MLPLKSNSGKEFGIETTAFWVLGVLLVAYSLIGAAKWAAIFVGLLHKSAVLLPGFFDLFRLVLVFSVGVLSIVGAVGLRQSDPKKSKALLPVLFSIIIAIPAFFIFSILRVSVVRNLVWSPRFEITDTLAFCALLGFFVFSGIFLVLRLFKLAREIVSLN